ncbi:hypothetical protein B0A55_01764 [Friedmanniomyces simplex]|uniref:Uncharacterized protein n=1 Tax=Friedmanniomyces simplex TaxID=329884 RepID=A0A4U0XR11_9PEZI|nr:hypothetical protein B0A55_01764 [Friedmanniomyces simplex]
MTPEEWDARHPELIRRGSQQPDRSTMDQSAMNIGIVMGMGMGMMGMGGFMIPVMLAEDYERKINDLKCAHAGQSRTGAMATCDQPGPRELELAKALDEERLARTLDNQSLMLKMEEVQRRGSETESELEQLRAELRQLPGHSDTSTFHQPMYQQGYQQYNPVYNQPYPPPPQTQYPYPAYAWGPPNQQLNQQGAMLPPQPPPAPEVDPAEFPALPPRLPYGYQGQAPPTREERRAMLEAERAANQLSQPTSPPAPAPAAQDPPARPSGVMSTEERRAMLEAKRADSNASSAPPAPAPATQDPPAHQFAIMSREERRAMLEAQRREAGGTGNQ